MKLAALAVLAVLALPPLAVAQEGAYYKVEDVTYYYALGHPATVQANWHRNETVPAEFDGCTWGKTRPDKGLGRINTIGSLQGLSLLGDFNNLFGEGGGGILRDTVIDGSFHGDGPQHPPVLATMAAWGNVSLMVDDLNFFDPATGRSTFVAEWFVTEDGYVDGPVGPWRGVDGNLADMSDAAVSEDGDWEMHLRIRSLPDVAPQEDHVDEVVRPDPYTVFTPDEGYQEVFAFRNERFGGTGQLEFEALSFALPGDNHLTMTLFAPGGREIFNTTLEPSLGSAAEDRLEFPLDRLGTYMVLVSGQVSASRYEVRLTQQTPPTFDLDLLWEEVVPGYAGVMEKQACDALIRGESLAALVLPRPDPPLFKWLITIMTIAAAITTVVVTANLLGHARATSRLRSTAGERR